MAADSLDSFADLISSSSTFQTMTSTTTAAGAKEYIYQDAKDDPKQDPDNQNTGYIRPFIIVAEDTDDYTITMGPFASGSFLMMFESDIQANQVGDHTTVMRDFRSDVHGVIRDIQNNQLAGGEIVIRDINSSEPSLRSDLAEGEDEGEPYVQRQFSVQYGVI